MPANSAQPVNSLPQALTGLTGAQFSTYKIGGTLDEAWQPTTQAEAQAVLLYYVNTDRPAGKSLTILGWGGNTLIASAGIRGVTLITRKMTWERQLDETTFEFGAGVHLAKVATDALTQSLHGGEYMIGIPGTVGGAVRMNAGALSQETSQLVKSVTLFNLATGQTEIWDQKALGFSYRHSNIDPTQHVVLSAVLQFTPGDASTIKTMMDQSVNFRRTHHPSEPNGGSVFKNPAPDKPVGRLIEELGGKNWQEGGARVSPLHGNFIINTGNATSLDVLRLMTRMKKAIHEQYGLTIHPENLIAGALTDEETTLWQALNA